MIRALRMAWLTFRFAWAHRHAWRLELSRTAEYSLTATEALDWEWREAQAALATWVNAEDPSENRDDLANE